MNVDLEFLRIVEELGPLEGFDSAYVDEAEDFGTTSHPESRRAGDPSDLEAPGPADRTVTPFPKWDPETRCWWRWHEVFGGWYPIPGPDPST